jgi:hypothetical protein
MFKAFCNVRFCMILYVMTYCTSSCLVTKLWIYGMYICMYVFIISNVLVFSFKFKTCLSVASIDNFERIIIS